MHLLPDPRALDLAARSLDGHADDVRQLALRLAAVSEATRWTSTGAAAFRDCSHRLCAELRRSAARIDDAAHALRSHSNTVRNQLAMIAAGSAALEDGVGAVSGAVRSGLAAVGIS
jgi:hypothetical protein